MIKCHESKPEFFRRLAGRGLKALLDEDQRTFDQTTKENQSEKLAYITANIDLSTCSPTVFAQLASTDLLLKVVLKSQQRGPLAFTSKKLKEKESCNSKFINVPTPMLPHIASYML